ncbi:MAG: thioredoxin family protein [Deinococcales bacterium]
MALTPSRMLELNTPAPDFHLLDTVSGKVFSRQDFQNQALLVMFICTHCPFVKHVEAELARLGLDYLAQNVAIVAVGSNDAQNYPDDAPDKLKAQAERMGFNFPYLYDESQEMAQAYSAACTPDFFLFDQGHKLVYRGQLDASRPKNDIPVTGKDLRQAIDALLAGQAVSSEQIPSIGCNIKWKPGKEPQ